MLFPEFFTVLYLTLKFKRARLPHNKCVQYTVNSLLGGHLCPFGFRRKTKYIYLYMESTVLSFYTCVTVNSNSLADSRTATLPCTITRQQQRGLHITYVPNYSRLQNSWKFFLLPPPRLILTCAVLSKAGIFYPLTV